MKITVLGSGSAYGSPMCFNRFGSNQNVHNPKNQRTRASIIIGEQGKNILIDMGPDFRSQINQNNIDNLDAVLISHGHYDHIAGVPELWRATEILDKQIPVYCSEETMSELKQSFRHMFKPNHEVDRQAIAWHKIEHNEKFYAAELEISAFGVPHHQLQTTCFRLHNFAYVPDLQDLPFEAKQQLQNLDLLMIECNNGFEKRENGHSDVEKILAWVAELEPKRTILTHLSAKIDYVQLKNALPANVEVAFDGMIIEI